MQMSDSDSDCSLSDLMLRRVDSGPKLHSAVPDDIEFVFKVKVREKSKRLPFLYTLKKGKKLPYNTEIEGLSFMTFIILLCFI